MAGSNLVQSLLRGVDILDILSGAPSGMALRDVAGALDVGPSTAHNLLRTLMERGFVAKDGTAYRLGDQIGHLYRRSVSGSWLDRCGEVLANLYKGHENATLTYDEQRGADLTVLLRIAPTTGGDIERPEGRTFGPYSSVSGLVMLAFADADHLAAVRLEHPFSEEGSRLWASHDELEAFLEKVRKQGYGVAPFKGDEGILRIAVPVFHPGGELRGILGMALSIEKNTASLQRRIAKELTTAASQLADV